MQRAENTSNKLSLGKSTVQVDAGHSFSHIGGISRMANNSKKIGYGKPPKEHQFKKGQSGNPNGRPKGTLNVATVVDKTLQEMVVVNENGEHKMLTKFEAAIKQMANKAALGDPRAFRELINLARYSETALQKSEQQNSRPTADLTDEELLAIACGHVK